MGRNQWVKDFRHRDTMVGDFATREAAIAAVLAATKPRPESRTPTLTADNQMTPKPNLALNAEIESSGRAGNSARCARAFLSLCPNRDRVGLWQPRCLPDDGPDIGGGVLDH